MSKEVIYLNSDNSTTHCPLSNNSEVKAIEEASLVVQDKEILEEGTQYSIAEQPVGCKIIALRLHHLELGQKKILRSIAGLHPICLLYTSPSPRDS